MRIEQGLLPDDYLEQRAERRTNAISLTLFAVVMSAVFAAFLVTNREWSRVRDAQQVMNAQYAEAGERIKDLKALEEQQSAMLDKAEIATALIERVPRSVLLADLVNRMPKRLSLLEFELKAEEVKSGKKGSKNSSSAATPGSNAKPAKTSSLKDAQRAKTKDEAAADAQKVEAPKHRFLLSLIGVAPTDADVSRYLAALNDYPVVQNVRLEISEEKEVEGQMLRQFKITMRLEPDADVSKVPRILAPTEPKDPMSDEMRFNNPTAGDDTLLQKAMNWMGGNGDERTNADGSKE